MEGIYRRGNIVNLRKKGKICEGMKKHNKDAVVIFLAIKDQTCMHIKPPGYLRQGSTGCNLLYN